MTISSWMKTIEDWVKEGLPNSEFFPPDYLKLEKVEGYKDRYILSQRELPYNLMIIVEENFLSIVVYTGIETATLSRDERLEIYRKMLIANDEIKLVKLVLYGRNDELAVRTDLDLATLGKEEFYDAIVSVIIGRESLRKILKMEDEEADDEKIKQTIVLLVKEMGRERVINMLVDKGGMSRADAEALVDSIIDEYNLEPPSPMYG